MSIPTLEKIQTELKSFLEHKNVAIKQQAQETLQYLEAISQSQLSEEQIKHFSENLVLESQKTSLNAIYAQKDKTLSFHKVLYHVFLYVGYHNPINKMENGQPLDAVFLEPIPPDCLFIASDRRHCDVRGLKKFRLRVGKFQNPVTRQPFLSQEIEKINNIQRFSETAIIYDLNSADNLTLLERLGFLASFPTQITPSVLATLVTLLKSDQPWIVTMVLQMLLPLSSKDKDAIREAQGIPLLLHCLQSDVKFIKQLVLIIFNDLTDNLANQNAIRKAQGIPVLIHLFYVEDECIRKDALLAFAPFMKNVVHQKEVAKAKGIPGLIHLLGSGDEDTKKLALFTLSPLIDNIDHQRAIVQAEGIPTFLTLLHSKDQDLRQFALGLLVHLARNGDAIREAEKILPLIHSLMNFLQSEDSSRREAALVILMYLLPNQVNQGILVEADIVPGLVDFIKSNQDSMINKEAAQFLKGFLITQFNSKKLWDLLKKDAEQQDCLVRVVSKEVIYPILRAIDEGCSDENQCNIYLTKFVEATFQNDADFERSLRENYLNSSEFDQSSTTFKEALLSIPRVQQTIDIFDFCKIMNLSRRLEGSEAQNAIFNAFYPTKIQSLLESISNLDKHSQKNALLYLASLLSFEQKKRCRMLLHPEAVRPLTLLGLIFSSKAMYECAVYALNQAINTCHQNEQEFKVIHKLAKKILRQIVLEAKCSSTEQHYDELSEILYACKRGIEQPTDQENLKCLQQCSRTVGGYPTATGKILGGMLYTLSATLLLISLLTMVIVASATSVNSNVFMSFIASYCELIVGSGLCLGLAIGDMTYCAGFFSRHGLAKVLPAFIEQTTKMAATSSLV